MFPIEFMLIDPALLIVGPLTVKLVALLIAKLSVFVPRVRVLVVSAAFIVTVEFAVLMHVFEVLVGTPDGVQLPARSQLPLPPFQVEVHCAKPDGRYKKSAASAMSNIRTGTLFRPKMCFASNKRLCMSVSPN